MNVDRRLLSAQLELSSASNYAELFSYPKEIQERIALVRRAVANLRKQIQDWKEIKAKASVLTACLCLLLGGCNEVPLPPAPHITVTPIVRRHRVQRFHYDASLQDPRLLLISTPGGRP